MREKITKIVGWVSFVMAVIPVAVAALLIWSHTEYCPFGPFLDSVTETVMEYGMNWTYWLALVFGFLGGAGVIATLFLAKVFPPRTIWIIDIFTVLFSLADILLFYMIFSSGSTISMVNLVAGKI